MASTSYSYHPVSSLSHSHTILLFSVLCYLIVSHLSLVFRVILLSYRSVIQYGQYKLFTSYSDSQVYTPKYTFQEDENPNDASYRLVILALTPHPPSSYTHHSSPYLNIYLCDLLSHPHPLFRPCTLNITMPLCPQLQQPFVLQQSV